MISYGKHFIDEDDIEAVTDVLRGGNLTQGEVIEQFENAIAKYVDAKYAVAVSSGTAALHIATIAAGLGKNESLVTSPITFVASANAGLYIGSEISFVDIDEKTINMSTECLAEKLAFNSKIKLIIPVHFAGLPCNMSKIKELADKSNAKVIEDAAHALGSTYSDGSRVGCCKNSLMTIFSFHPVKSIATGEGGMITTNDESVYRKLLRLRSHGINKLDDSFELPDQAYKNNQRNPWYYEMQEIGFHYRITDFQCALGLSQLKKLEKFIERRRYLVCRYDQAFSSMKYLRPGQATGRNQSAHHLYPLCIDFSAIKQTRGNVMRALSSKGIGTQVHYIPVPAQPFYRRLGHRPESYPNAQIYYESALTLPLFYGLSDAHQDKVIAAIKELENGIP